MADEVVLMDDSGESQTYENVETIEVDNGDGSTTKYVNENLIDKLPAVTEADNGKVFGVVDGKWQAMDAPSGGGSGLPDVTETDNGKFLGVYNGEWGARNVPAPESYPASQVAGLAPVATNGTYDSLYLAPVGPKYVIPPHDATFTRDDNSRWRFSTVAEYAPTVGTECEVTWKGETFIKTLRDCAEVTGLVGEGYGFIGNAYIFTGDTADNTEEEFLFIILHEEYRLVLCCTSYLNAGAIGVSFQIAIPGQVKKLDAKYLPDGIATEEFVRDAVAAVEGSGGGGTAVTEKDILPAQTISGFAQDGSAGGAYTAVITPTLYQLVPGQTYTVVWDEVVYPDLVCATVTMNNMPWDAIGNGAIGGLEDTGEPFAITSITNEDGTVAYNVIAATTAETEHTVRIYQVQAVAAEPAAVPEYDLTAMGLPDVPLDGTTVMANCDTEVLTEAIRTGVVTFRLTAMGNAMSITGGAVGMDGAFQVSALAWLSGMMFAGCIMVDEGRIDAFVKPLTNY